MTFQQLQYLQEVARTGSISGAAKNLFLAQSSVSASISNLEKELGYPIFVRGKKGVIPTAQGAEVIEQASRICDSYRLMEEIGRAKSKKHIRISAPMIEPLDEAFVELVAKYAGNEDVIFSAASFSFDESIEKVASFMLDAAVVLVHDFHSQSTDTMLKTQNLTGQTIATLPTVVQLSSQHPLYEKETIEISDLQNHLFVDNIHTPMVYNKFLNEIIRLSTDHTVTVRSSYAQHLLVEKGIAYSIGVGTPKEINNATGLRSVPLKNVNYRLIVVTNSQKQSGKEIEDYIKFIKKALEC